MTKLAKPAKKSKQVALVIALITFAAAKAQGSATGIITVTARILNPTCQVDVNGSSSATLNMPTVTAASFKSGSMSAGATPFTINLTGCSNGIETNSSLGKGTVNVLVSKNEAKGGLDIPLTGGKAGNLVFRMSQSGTTGTWSASGTQLFPVSIVNGTGKVSGLQIYYQAKALPVTAGTMAAALTVSLQYN